MRNDLLKKPKKQVYNFRPGPASILRPAYGVPRGLRDYGGQVIKNNGC